MCPSPSYVSSTPDDSRSASCSAHGTASRGRSWCRRRRSARHPRPRTVEPRRPGHGPLRAQRAAEPEERADRRRGLLDLGGLGAHLGEVGGVAGVRAVDRVERHRRVRRVGAVGLAVGVLVGELRAGPAAVLLERLGQTLGEVRPEGLRVERERDAVERERAGRPGRCPWAGGSPRARSSRPRPAPARRRPTRSAGTGSRPGSPRCRRAGRSRSRRPGPATPRSDVSVGGSAPSSTMRPTFVGEERRVGGAQLGPVGEAEVGELVVTQGRAQHVEVARGAHRVDVAEERARCSAGRPRRAPRRCRSRAWMPASVE